MEYLEIPLSYDFTHLKWHHTTTKKSRPNSQLANVLISKFEIARPIGHLGAQCHEYDFNARQSHRVGRLLGIAEESENTKKRLESTDAASLDTKKKFESTGAAFLDTKKRFGSIDAAFLDTEKRFGSMDAASADMNKKVAHLNTTPTHLVLSFTLLSIIPTHVLKKVFAISV